MSPKILTAAIVVGGIGQLALVVASTLIPRLLHWREEIAKLRPLTRQVVTVYAVYILCTNLAFGLLSTLAPRWLTDGSGLATAVCGFIALYWGARLIIQFTYYDRKDAPPGAVFRIAEVLLVLLFFYLSVVYGLVAWQGIVR